MNYTKGPWVVSQPNGIGNGYKAGPAWLGEKARTIETKDNANLIAAAPNIYEALKAAIECGMVPITSAAEGGAARYVKQVQVADQIRDAIAKAEGRSDD